MILDKDLADIYGITKRNLNKAVEMNRERFPEDSIFQLSIDEYNTLEFQNTSIWKNQHPKTLPHAFTQEGIAKIPGILNSERVTEANIQILGTFNRQRELLLTTKNEYYQNAFEIACNKVGDFDELETNIFLGVMQLIGDNVVDQIESFVASNKGILLIGGDYDMLSGIASYIWYSHPLLYPFKGNVCLGHDFEYSRLVHQDFYGYIEEETKASLFSQPNGLMNKYQQGTVLFLRDIKFKYTDVLERLARIIRGFKTYSNGGKSDRTRYDPNIVILNTKQIDRLPDDFLQMFEVINIRPLKQKRKDVLQNSLKGKRNTKGLGRGKRSRIPNKEFVDTLKEVYRYCKRRETEKGERLPGTKIAIYAMRHLKKKYGDTHNAAFNQQCPVRTTASFF